MKTELLVRSWLKKEATFVKLSIKRHVFGTPTLPWLCLVTFVNIYENFHLLNKLRNNFSGPYFCVDVQLGTIL